MKYLIFCFTLFFLTIHAPINAQQGIKLISLANGFIKPLDIVNIGDERLFVVSQPGVIYLMDTLGNKNPTPFLDINDSVINSGNERGLLGLAFHPNYAQNGYFYVNYIGNDGNSRISRFQVSTDPNVADKSSEQILLNVTQPYTNHNGGCLKFGPDGYLYAGFGDGGSGGDPQANAQNPKKMLGKMLRLDVDNGSPYSIPPDNPFINNSDTLPEIWTLGWRNPWRFSFDKLTGDLWVGDVGQDTWEEIDMEPAGSKGGKNYGWRCYEGNAVFNPANCGPKESYVFPVWAFDQNSGDCSVTGGYVYRGSRYPGLYGKYIYLDYCSCKIHALYKDNTGNYTDKLLADLTNQDYSGFGQDGNGELYVAGLSTGNIFKLTMNCDTFDTQATFIYPCTDSASGSIALTTSGDISYQWSNGQEGNSVDNLEAGNYNVTVVNNDNFCGSIFSFKLNSLPIPDLKLTWKDSILSLNESVVYDSIQWYKNGVAIPGANNTNYMPAKSGAYYAVFMVKESSCVYVSETSNIITTSLDSKQYSDKISLWPNPVKDQLYIYDESNMKNQSYRIMDISGRILKKGSLGLQEIISVAELHSGFYFIEIKNIQRTQVLKFQKN